MVLIQNQTQMQPSRRLLLCLPFHPQKMEVNHFAVPPSMKVGVSFRVMPRIPKRMSKAVVFRNLQNPEGTRKAGAEMGIALRLLKIIIPKITLENICPQGMTVVKLVQEIARGLERKMMPLMVRVQVLGMVLTTTAMTAMGSLADT